MPGASNGRCCVFQPFDKGPHDKRYTDTVAPAVEAADLIPYRVDRDDGAVIPIETLHDEIKAATVCLADITTRNANVMYELGYAIASGKDVVLICSEAQADNFPFDIQHRSIIKYSQDSASDFAQLKNSITKRLEAILKKQETTQTVSTTSPLRATEGLQPMEVAALALIMANVDSSNDGVSTNTIKTDMEKAGYTRLASQLALTRLSRMGYIIPGEDSDYNGNSWVVYKMLPDGEDWLLDHQDRLELKAAPPPPVRRVSRFGTDDDVPF
jgi:nucleoside 2-deoxyribosyltransferase